MMGEEIQKWFTEHGKVLEAITEEDKASPVPGTTVIRYKFEDGAELVIRPAKYGEDGTLTQEQQIVTRQLPKPKEQQAGGTKEGDTRGPQTGPTREVYRGGKWVVEPNPVYQAPTADPKQSTVKGADGRTYVVTVDAQGTSTAKPVEGLPADPDAAPKPTTVATNTTEPYIVTRQPDGTIKADPNPNYQGEKPKPGTNQTVKGGDGKTYVVPIDANGNVGQPRDLGIPGEAKWTEVSRTEKTDANGTKSVVITERNDNDPTQTRQRTATSEDETKAPAAPLPAGVPEFRPDFTKPDLGLRDRKSVLDQLVRENVITPKQALDAMTFDSSMAASEAKNLGYAVEVQTGNRSADLTARSQDITQASNRLTFANNRLQQAFNTAASSKVLPGAGGAIADELGASLALSQAYAAGLGGLTDARPYNPAAYPVLAGYGALGYPGITSPAGSFTPAQQAPTISINLGGQQPASAAVMPGLGAPAPVPAAPNALGLGAPPALPQWEPNGDGVVDDLVSAGFDDDVLQAAIAEAQQGAPMGGAIPSSPPRAGRGSLR